MRVASSWERPAAAKNALVLARRRGELFAADAKIRGMFLSEALRLAPRLVKSATQQTRYVPFSLYPVQDYMRLLLRIAAARSPSKSAGTALLELGFGVYSQFASSIVHDVHFERSLGKIGVHASERDGARQREVVAGCEGRQIGRASCRERV